MRPLAVKLVPLSLDRRADPSFSDSSNQDEVSGLDGKISS